MEEEDTGGVGSMIPPEKLHELAKEKEEVFDEIREHAVKIEELTHELPYPFREIVLYANAIVKDIAEMKDITPYVEEKIEQVKSRLREVL